VKGEKRPIRRKFGEPRGRESKYPRGRETHEDRRRNGAAGTPTGNDSKRDRKEREVALIAGRQLGQHEKFWGR